MTGPAALVVGDPVSRRSEAESGATSREEPAVQEVIHGPQALRGAAAIPAATVVAELGWSSRFASARPF